MKIVTLLSGGLDSAVLLGSMVADGHEVMPLSVDYGQRHRRELQAAELIAGHYQLPWKCADLRNVGRELLAGSALTSPNIAVPHGHYEDLSMKATVVPNRNMILLAIGLGYAISIGAKAVAYAAHAGDHAIYPDCRPEFYAALSAAFQVAHYEAVELIGPMIQWTKADIVKQGHNLSVPMKTTWSCYEGGRLHCGRCGTCVERKEAFLLAGVPDPTSYLDQGTPSGELFGAGGSIAQS